mgnify:CR=1 FL=1
MKKDKVLWADDEIDLLKPHILFLKEKAWLTSGHRFLEWQLLCV